MLAQNILTTDRTMNSLLDCHARSNSKSAGAILETMSQYGIKPDLFTYTNLIRQSANNRDYKSALAYLKGMLQKGIRPDVPFITALACSYDFHS